jgi:hypothetical protein
MRLKALKAKSAAWRTRRSSGVVSILTLGRNFSKGDFSLTSIVDAKTANGILGPIFIGMVMGRVVVVVGPITPVARGERHAGRDAWS